MSRTSPPLRAFLLWAFLVHFLLGSAAAARGQETCRVLAPDYEGLLLPSESVEGDPQGETEIADDFDLPEGGYVTTVRWWGGYPSGDVHADAFAIRFYEDLDCAPGDVTAEYIVLAPHESFACEKDGIWIYEYHWDVCVARVGRMWLSIRAASGAGTGLVGWGRLATELASDGCESMIRQGPQNAWDWMPVNAVFGQAFVASAELMCDEGCPIGDWPPEQPDFLHPCSTAVEPTTWGKLKLLYR